MNPLFRHLEGRHPEGCLTLYIERGPGYDPRFYDAQLKDFEQQLPQEPAVAGEIVRVREFIASARPPGLPLAVFSMEAAGIFDARRLPEDVDSRAVFGERFDLNELARQLERRPPGIVAVVEKGSARLYSVVLEEVRELEHIEGERVVPDIRPDYEKGRPRNQAAVNLRHAAQELARLAVPRRGYEAVYVAGPEEARAEFRKLLPRSVQQRIVAEFGVTLDVPPTQLANELRTVLSARLTE